MPAGGFVGQMKTFINTFLVKKTWAEWRVYCCCRYFFIKICL